MKNKLNAKAAREKSPGNTFSCDKLKSLLYDDNHSQSFAERCSNRLNIYTKDAREKIRVDIESYHAG